MNKSNIKLETGDIVRVTRNDGKQYDMFITETFDRYNLLCGRVLESSKDKVATTSWKRYNLEENGICQLIDECSNISTLSEGKKVELEGVDDTRLYQNTVPGTNKVLTFCLSEDFGGWSESSNTDDAILESCSRANSAQCEEVVESGR